MLKKIFTLLLITSSLILSGCASNASVDQMVYSPPQIQKQSLNSQLHNNVEVGQITGGKETGALWTPQVNNAGLKSALEQSLQKANLYRAAPQDAKFILNANLDKLDVPLDDVAMKVTCVIHYQLIALATKKTIYDKIITSSFAPELNLYQANVTRQKAGVEGAVKTNIGQLISDLYELKAPA
jgi:hypothetical protein